MKYFRLKKDLPTFKAGDLFYLDDLGSLYRASDDIMAYYYKTIAKFPDMLEDWFEPAPASIRDVRTRAAFEAYLQLHPDERFFQAVRNFTGAHLKSDSNFVFVGSKPEELEDTFYWECDDLLSSGLSEEVTEDE